jgi:pimeloyl-ACP methyl ester carboxylesterase
MLNMTSIALIAASAILLASPINVAAQADSTTASASPVTTGYAPVNGLRMYYEIHGAGEPLVVIHGAYMTIETLGPIVSMLALERQVIAVELQGHGHTADIDRPLSYELLADDTAGLVRHLGIQSADVFGYSLGGGVALQLALRHPELVRKLVVASAPFASDGQYPEVLASVDMITPELFAGTPIMSEYERVAPDPQAFPALVSKLKALDSEPFAWPAEDIRTISAPTLVVIGDSDAVRPEHAVELFRLLGGGVMGDLTEMPKSQLAVLPGSSHIGLVYRAEWLRSMIGAFLDPAPQGAP